MPNNVHIMDNVIFVHDLMTPYKTEWNSTLVAASFPSNVSKAILSLPLANREHDEFVRAPSLTGAFSVRSSYKVNNTFQIGLLYNERKRKWSVL